MIVGRWCWPWGGVVLLFGCATSATPSWQPGVGGAVDEPGSASGAAGAGGAADERNSTLTPSGFARCGELYPARADQCDGLELLVVDSPRVGANEDGSIFVGQTLDVNVYYDNPGELDYFNVCLGLKADVEGIQVLPYHAHGTNPTVIDYVAPGERGYEGVASLRVGDVAPGTTVRFVAWATFEGSNCLGATATVDAMVRPDPFN